MSDQASLRKAVRPAALALTIAVLRLVGAANLPA